MFERFKKKIVSDISDKDLKIIQNKNKILEEKILNKELKEKLNKKDTKN